MKSTFLYFGKTEKSPQVMEREINDLLSKSTFKFATQTEIPTSGKILVSLFTDEGESKVKAKVFRESFVQKLEKQINDFLATGVKMKLFTKTCVGNTILAVMYYE
jgi:hypothetical protein